MHSHQSVLKGLDDLHYFLGIEVLHSSSSLFLLQRKYVLDLLCKFQLHTIELVKTYSAA